MAMAFLVAKAGPAGSNGLPSPSSGCLRNLSKNDISPDGEGMTLPELGKP
ncbi:hypothetical protein [Nocardia sp. NPDC057440]